MLLGQEAGRKGFCGEEEEQVPAFQSPVLEPELISVQQVVVAVVAAASALQEQER